MSNRSNYNENSNILNNSDFSEAYAYLEARQNKRFVNNTHIFIIE